MEKKAISAGAGAVLAEGGQKDTVAGGVGEHEPGPAERPIEVKGLELVATAGQARVGSVETRHGLLAVLGQYALQAAGAARLVDDNFVAAKEQLHGQAAEDGGVTVRPIRKERGVKQHDTHAASGGQDEGSGLASFRIAAEGPSGYRYDAGNAVGLGGTAH
jgi:hypothetical protein